MNEHWQILVVCFMAMGILDGISLWATRFIVARAFAGQRDQYRDEMTKATQGLKEAAEKLAAYQTVQEQVRELRGQIASSLGLERDFLKLKADLPIDYVRKEDFIRHEVVINTKLDRITDKLIELLGGTQCK